MHFYEITLSEYHHLKLFIQYERPYQENGQEVIVNAAIVRDRIFIAYTPNDITRMRREFGMFERGDEHNRILKLDYVRSRENQKRKIPVLTLKLPNSKEILTFGKSDAGTISDALTGAFSRMNWSLYAKGSKVSSIQEWIKNLERSGFLK